MQPSHCLSAVLAAPSVITSEGNIRPCCLNSLKTFHILGSSFDGKTFEPGSFWDVLFRQTTTDTFAWNILFESRSGSMF